MVEQDVRSGVWAKIDVRDWLGYAMIDGSV